MRSLKDVIEHYIPGESEEFARWAFGQDYRDFVERIRFLTSWNELHGQDLELTGNGKPGEDIPKMIDLWKASKKDDPIV